MSDRLAELQLMLGESRRRLGALADRVGELRRRIEPGASAGAGSGASPGGSHPFAESAGGASDVEEIDDLDLKFEALVVDTADQDEIPES